jgi:ATP-dependent Lhr-like helicase
MAWIRETAGVGDEVAEMVVRYLDAARIALGRLPTKDDVVIERFFDDSGGMQLVVHAPFGARINRGLGLALRKRFCVSFDFELQAAASDDAVVLSLGPQHSFPLDSVPRFLSSKTVEGVLRQAVLASPMFTARWRWNLNRALVVLRQRAGRRNPPPIQRMEADDLMAAVFPALAACQENATGPIEIPDHPIVRQTMYDCLHEALDIDGLEELVRGFESGAVRVHALDTIEPSPLSHEILSGKPFTYLDDAPLEERRSRAVQLRRGLPLEARHLGALDADVVDRVRAEARPDPRDPDELHDTLLSLVVLAPDPEWADLFAALVDRGRAFVARRNGRDLWCAVENRERIEEMFSEGDGADAAAALALRGHLDVLGPVTAEQLGDATTLAPTAVAVALARLETEGFALRGHFDPAVQTEQWCARRLLTRIHIGTQKRLRREIEPVSPAELMRFLLRWQHVAPGTQREGRAGLVAVLEQLQGFEVPAGAWEEAVFSGRVDGYRSEWLDGLGLSGDLAWGRLSPRPPEVEPKRASATPSRATPIAFALRDDFGWILRTARGAAVPVGPGPGVGQEVLSALRARGALFRSELRHITGRLPTEVDEGLWDGVARGLVTSDSFAAVRTLLSPKERWARRNQERRRGLRSGANGRGGGEGRWVMLPDVSEAFDTDELAEAVAEQLLARWGVIFYDLLTRETLALPWREIVWALRRLEARGVVRGGRFVHGFSGEQYARPEAVDMLRKVRRAAGDGEIVRLSAADPLNLVGVITPGPRTPAIRTNTVILRDGVPVSGGESALASSS